MRIFLALLLWIVIPAAFAANPYGYVFTVSPSPVPPGGAIGVTIQTTIPQCVALPDTLDPLIESNVVLLVLPTSDGCANVPPESRDYEIGPLPAGAYVFRFMACGGNPPPGSPNTGCVTLEDVSLTVLGLSSSTFTVPALSAAAAVGLGALFAILGALVVRASRPC